MAEMADWVTLGAMVTILGTLAAVQIVLIRGVKDDLHKLSVRVDAMDHKFERKFEHVYQKFDQVNQRFDQVNLQILDINRRLPAAPELVVSSSKWR
jgi:predicted PurR-regulated permease PerM